MVRIKQFAKSPEFISVAEPRASARSKFWKQAAIFDEFGSIHQ
jgi:hypothetical protein